MENEKDIFLKRCSEVDKEKLLGKRKMSFADFEKYMFLTDYFGFWEYGAEIYHTYAKDFQGQLNTLIALWEEENWEKAVAEESEEELSRKDAWIMEFEKRIV